MHLKYEMKFNKSMFYADMTEKTINLSNTCDTNVRRTKTLHVSTMIFANA